MEPSMGAVTYSISSFSKICFMPPLLRSLFENWARDSYFKLYGYEPSDEEIDVYTTLCDLHGASRRLRRDWAEALLDRFIPTSYIKDLPIGEEGLHLEGLQVRYFSEEDGAIPFCGTTSAPKDSKRKLLGVKFSKM